jgi:hypothetical protein
MVEKDMELSYNLLLIFLGLSSLGSRMLGTFVCRLDLECNDDLTHVRIIQLVFV